MDTFSKTDQVIAYVLRMPKYILAVTFKYKEFPERSVIFTSHFETSILGRHANTAI